MIFQAALDATELCESIQCIQQIITLNTTVATILCTNIALVSEQMSFNKDHWVHLLFTALAIATAESVVYVLALSYNLNYLSGTFTSCQGEEETW